MAAQVFDDRGCPPPILEHDAGDLTEISRVGAVENCVPSSSCLTVNGMTKLVEQRASIIMLEEAGLIRKRL